MRIVHAHRMRYAKKVSVLMLIISFIFQPLTFAQVQLTSTDQNTQVPVIVVEPDQSVSDSGSTPPADIQSTMPMSPLSLPDSIIGASAISPPDPADPLLAKTNITQNSVEPNLTAAAIETPSVPIIQPSDILKTADLAVTIDVDDRIVAHWLNSGDLDIVNDNNVRAMFGNIGVTNPDGTFKATYQDMANNILNTINRGFTQISLWTPFGRRSFAKQADGTWGYHPLEGDYWVMFTQALQAKEQWGQEFMDTWSYMVNLIKEHPEVDFLLGSSGMGGDPYIAKYLLGPEASTISTQQELSDALLAFHQNLPLNVSRFESLYDRVYTREELQSLGLSNIEIEARLTRQETIWNDLIWPSLELYLVPGANNIQIELDGASGATTHELTWLLAEKLTKPELRDPVVDSKLLEMLGPENFRNQRFGVVIETRPDKGERYAWEGYPTAIVWTNYARNNPDTFRDAAEIKLRDSDLESVTAWLGGTGGSNDISASDFSVAKTALMNGDRVMIYSHMLTNPIYNPIPWAHFDLNGKAITYQFSKDPVPTGSYVNAANLAEIIRAFDLHNPQIFSTQTKKDMFDQSRVFTTIQFDGRTFTTSFNSNSWVNRYIEPEEQIADYIVKKSYNTKDDLIQYLGINSLPTNIKLQVSAPEGTPLTFILEGNNDSITYQSSQNNEPLKELSFRTAHGTVKITLGYYMRTVTANGNTWQEKIQKGDLDFVQYIPDAGYTGQDGFTYKILDQNGNVSKTASVAIGVGEAAVPVITVSPQAVPVIPGDANQDGTVDTADYTLIRDAMETYKAYQAADFTGDGKVDSSDVQIFTQNLGRAFTYPVGDINHDSHVDAADFTIIQDAMTTNNLIADLNGDKKVDDQDYQIWRANFGDAVLPGDADRNGTVDLKDFAFIQNAISAYQEYQSADVNKDGRIDEADIAAWRTRFNATTAPTDAAAPIVSNTTVTNVGPREVSVNWSTDEISTTQIEYVIKNNYGVDLLTVLPLDSKLVTSHSFTMTDLQPNTTYQIRIKSQDKDGNLTVANELTVTTLPPAPDTQKPIISEIRTSNVTSSGANIFWVTNELADMTIEYQAEGSSEINTISNPDTSITHAAQLRNLKADTTYYFRVKSKNAAGNLASSDDRTGLQPYSVYSFTTLPDETIPDVNAVIVAQGKTTADQFVIPLYANGTSGRAGQIIGWGISSSLVGTANTQNQPIKALMVADTNGVPLEQPVIRDISILGHDDTNRWSNGSWGNISYHTCGSADINPNGQWCTGPNIWNGSPAANYDGLVMNANGATLQNLRLFFVPGTAIQIKQSGDLATVLHDISIMRVFNGIDLQSGKFDLENIEITGAGDFDLRVENGSEAAIKNFHGWSGSTAVSLEVLAGGKVYVEGIYSEQASVGIRLEGNESYVTGMYSWANHIANAEIFGQFNQIEGFTVDTSENGAGFIIGNGNGTSGHGTVINDGNMYVANNSVGIRVLTDQVIINNTKLGGYNGTSGRIGIQVEKVISNSVIDVDCAYLNVCLDLNYNGISGLGTGNIIRLRNTGDANIQMINLPDTWDPSNQIYINGSLIVGSNGNIQNPTVAVSIPKIDPFHFNLPPSVKPLVASDMQNVPSGYLIVPSGTTSIDQFMIPRLGDGEHHPAGQIMGVDELTSILSATADTKNQAMKAIVYTQDWGNHLAEIQAGTGQANYLPALLDPLIRDVTIKGYAGDVSGNVALDQGRADLYNGVFFGSDGGQIENTTISGIPGTALTTVRYGAIASGIPSPYDATKPTLRNLTILNSFKGLEVIGADQFLSNISVGNVRDYAIHLVGAAAQVYGVHTFGTGDIGIWFSTGPSWLNGAIETEGQKIGMLIDADQTGGASTSMVNDLYSHDHSTTNVQIKADSVIFHNFKLEVMPGATGFDISGQRTTLDQGTIALEGNNSVGIHLSNIGGWGTTVKNVTVTGTGAAGQVGLMLDNPNQWVDPATHIGHDLPLIGADIDVTFSNVETAVNLFPNGRNMIGYNNTIRITTLDGDPNKMIKLPPTWDTNSNKIYINGVLIQNGDEPLPQPTTPSPVIIVDPDPISTPPIQIADQSLTLNAAAGQDGHFVPLTTPITLDAPEGAQIEIVNGPHSGILKPSVLAGDANGDGRVNQADLDILSSSYNQTGTSLSADFNHDEKVNSSDLAILASNWGKANHEFLYFPVGDFASDNFTYKAVDQNGNESNIVLVEIKMPDPPVQTDLDNALTSLHVPILSDDVVKIDIQFERSLRDNQRAMVQYRVSGSEVWIQKNAFVNVDGTYSVILYDLESGSRYEYQILLVPEDSGEAMAQPVFISELQEFQTQPAIEKVNILGDWHIFDSTSLTNKPDEFINATEPVQIIYSGACRTDVLWPCGKDMDQVPPREQIRHLVESNNGRPVVLDIEHWRLTNIWHPEVTEEQLAINRQLFVDTLTMFREELSTYYAQHYPNQKVTLGLYGQLGGMSGGSLTSWQMDAYRATRASYSEIVKFVDYIAPDFYVRFDNNYEEWEARANYFLEYSSYYNKPIIPFIMPIFHDEPINSDLRGNIPLDWFESMVAYLKNNSDGIVFWYSVKDYNEFEDYGDILINYAKESDPSTPTPITIQNQSFQIETATGSNGLTVPVTTSLHLELPVGTHIEIASGPNHGQLVPVPLLGDMNRNGVVDSSDYLMIQIGARGENLAADFNRDGIVSNSDLAIWQNNFGKTANEYQYFPYEIGAYVNGVLIDSDSFTYRVVDQSGNVSNVAAVQLKIPEVPPLVAATQTVTIDPRNLIAVNFGFGGNTVPVVYDEGDPDNPYDDISNAMMGWSVLENGWAPVIQQFENDVDGGIMNFSVIALFGRPGLYNKDLANFIGEPIPDGFVDFAPGYYDMPLTSWHYLNGPYREWYINKYGQEPPVLATFNLWKEFNDAHPDVKIVLDFGSPHNDYDLRELAARLEREGNPDPFHAQEYWDYLWSALEPVFRVGFRNIVMDNSSGNAQYPATRRMLEVLIDPSKRDCAGLDHLLCGEGAPIQANEKVEVIVEAKPMLGDDYIYQMDYWGDDRYLRAFQHDGFDPVHFGPDDLYSGTAWRYLWWYFNGTHPDVNDLYQTARNVLADGDIALIQDLVQTGSTEQYTQYAGFKTVEEFLQNLNVSSIPVKIDLRSGNANEDNLTYIITDPPKDQNGNTIGTLVQNTYYPYIYKFTPNAGFSGAVTFKYKVSDGMHESEEAIVTIDVKPIKPVDSESNHPSPVQVENPNPITDPTTPAAVLSPLTSNPVEPVVANDLSIPISQKPATDIKEANSAPLSIAQIATKRELIQPWIETKELEGNKPSKSKEGTDIFAFIKNKKERAESRRTAKRMGLNKNRKISSKEFLVFWPSLKAALQTQDLDSIARYDVNGDGKLDQEDINFFIKTADTSK